MKHLWVVLLLLASTFSYIVSTGSSASTNSTQDSKISETLTTDTTVMVTQIISQDVSKSVTIKESTTTQSSSTTFQTTAGVVSSSASTSLTSETSETTTTSTSIVISTSSTIKSSTSAATDSSSLEDSSKITTTTKSSTTIKTETPIPSPTACSILSGVKISETNILLTDSENESYFVEMLIDSNITNVWLVILDASKSNKTETLLKHECTIKKNKQGIYTYTISNETDFLKASKNLQSVLIALYEDKSHADDITMCGSYDILMYSSNGNISAGLSEEFSNHNLIIDHKKLTNHSTLSLSRCSAAKEANNAIVLTDQSRDETNKCDLKNNQTLGMKLTRVEQACSVELFPGFNKSLTDNVISDINRKQQCGFALFMLLDMKIINLCPSHMKEIDISFTVRSAFPDQLSLIVTGYQYFVTKSKLVIDNEVYNLTGCSLNCFNNDQPPPYTDDNKIRVTVAIVVSCITIFLVILLFVFIYLKKKKSGILQFSMNRLDEDDDLIGDMDDFVGNQGPTFRSFK